MTDVRREVGGVRCEMRSVKVWGYQRSVRFKVCAKCSNKELNTPRTLKVSGHSKRFSKHCILLHKPEGAAASIAMAQTSVSELEISV